MRIVRSIALFIRNCSFYIQQQQQPKMPLSLHFKYIERRNEAIFPVLHFAFVFDNIINSSSQTV